MQRVKNGDSNLDIMTQTLLLDLKDNINHGICVCNLTYLIAKKMNFDEVTCYDLALAGLVHDIGKLKLASYLYGRAEDSFLVEGMKYMRMHSRLSYDILQYYDFSPFILQSVLYHHENYDGTGYPENLKGEDIPFGARVLRLADTFSALISDRPYRKAFDSDSAMEIMIDEINCYDMEAFIAFQKLIHEPGTIDMIKASDVIITNDYDDILTKIFTK